MNQWWVMYAYEDMLDLYPGPHSDAVIEALGETRRPTILRVLADLSSRGVPCAFCQPQTDKTCPGMEIHVSIGHDRMLTESGHMVRTGKVMVPAGASWDAAMKLIPDMIATGNFVDLG